MLGVDPESGASLVRLWIAAGSAALLVALCAAAFLAQARLASKPAMRLGLVVAAAIFGSIMTWALVDREVLAGASAERRAPGALGPGFNAPGPTSRSPLAPL